jgi:hypothetical protein
MYAVATFLVVAVLTTAFGLFATGALIATGVPPEIAAFQARSAFSGAGFTTTEAENVVNHPTRRKIISTTMFVGSLGTPTLVVTVMVGLIAPGPGSTTERSLVVISGICGVLLAILNRPVRKRLVRYGQRYATRRLLPALSEKPAVLLELGDGYEVEEFRLAQDPEETVRGLRGLDHALVGVKVLGVRRGDDFFGEQPVDITLAGDDALIVYGHRDRLDAIHHPDNIPDDDTADDDTAVEDTAVDNTADDERS